jgi:hypothetical protein
MKVNNAFELFKNYEKIYIDYGPFTLLDLSEVADIDINRVWSSASVDDGIHLINGFHQGSAVDLYLKSVRPCNLQPFQLDVFEVIAFECPYCESASDCTSCEGEAWVEIDFEKYVTSTAPGDRNAETLWQSITVSNA